MSDDNTPARADVKPGDKVAGYLLEEQIGQGGMAVVYRAYDERLDRRVALKVLAPSLAADNAFRTRFIRESRVAATVEHPHIIPVYDAGDGGGCLFISMRYVQGGDVRSLLTDGKALPPPRAWNIITQVASALDMAHTHNLVHRDVKPANMLIDGSAKDTQQNVNASGPVTEHIYLSDFGISKQTVASNLTSTGQFVGTLDYIAPEQIEGRGLDGRADQYSLACAAFELLCGDPPFTGPNIFALINAHLSEQPPSASKLQPGLPPGVDRVLAKAMDKSPARRYASCAQFATDLGRALGLVPGSLEADGGPTMVPGGEGASQPQQYQATELASPGLAAAQAGAAAAVGAAAQAGAAGAVGAAAPVQETAQDAPAAPAAAATAGPAAVPSGAGVPPVADQQTMTAGQQSGQAMQAPPAAGPQQAGTGQQLGGQQVAPGQYWQGQQGPSGPQWPAGTGQPGPYGQYQPYQTYPQPGAPGGPSGPGWPQQQPARRSRGPLIGAIVGAVAVIAAGTVVAITVLNKNPATPNPPPVSSPGHGTTSPKSPSATAQSQATAINTLLLNSEQSRSRWNSNVLVSNVGQCINIDRDVSQIQQITDQRSSEYNQATALQTDMIPNGATLKSQLMAALKISLRIDNDYLAWAQQQQSSGCSVGTNSSYYQQATQLDSQATTDKEIFVGTWNPDAVRYGLMQFSAGQI